MGEYEATCGPIGCGSGNPGVPGPEGIPYVPASQTTVAPNRKISILGADYTIIIKKYNEDETFERDGIDGYCYSHTRQIVVCDMTTYKGWEHEPAETVAAQQKETLRHEIVHAFFNESGLKCNAASVGDSWARNEEMVDWFAIQGPKIYKAWQEVGAL